MKNHVRVRRQYLASRTELVLEIFSEDERIRSIELTGDINYRIAIYGSDSDPRALTSMVSFSKRGLIEFVEILKLDVAFFYDLLGATGIALSQRNLLRRHR